MRTKIDLQLRVIVALMAMALLLQPTASAEERPNLSSGQEVQTPAQTVDAPQSSASHPGDVTLAPAQPLDNQLPDSPGALQSKTDDGVQSQSNGQSAVQQPRREQENRLHEPVGTAAAEWLPVMGVAASRPAGAALAPAKQRRARAVVIKVGALLAAGAAVGTVMALSEASPSRPPGSR